MARNKVNPELIDEDNPEWTAEDFARARPAREVLPELFGRTTAEKMLQPKRGRPALLRTKEHVNIRLDADILDAFRTSGAGWQTRMNNAMRDWLQSHPQVQ